MKLTATSVSKVQSGAGCKLNGHRQAGRNGDKITYRQEFPAPSTLLADCAKRNFYPIAQVALGLATQLEGTAQFPGKMPAPKSSSDELGGSGEEAGAVLCDVSPD